MRIFIICFCIVACSVLFGCSVTKLQTQGSVSPNDFYYETKFTTAKTLVVLPIKFEGVERNFLFDTGAQLTVFHADTVQGASVKISGATNRTVEMGQETIKSFKIGDVDFKNTIALNGDLTGIKKQVENFGGLIGQSIIAKANWLINYPEKKMKISNKNLIDNSYKPIKIKRKDGSPYIMLNVEGKEYKALIDLGSSVAMAIPEDSELAKSLLAKYKFEDNEREIFTVGGMKKTKEKKGVLPIVKIEGFEFENVKTDIRHTSKIRIGNDFFKDYIVYINNSDKNYCLKKIN